MVRYTAQATIDNITNGQVIIAAPMEATQKLENLSRILREKAETESKKKENHEKSAGQQASGLVGAVVGLVHAGAAKVHGAGGDVLVACADGLDAQVAELHKNFADLAQQIFKAEHGDKSVAQLIVDVFNTHVHNFANPVQAVRPPQPAQGDQAPVDRAPVISEYMASARREIYAQIEKVADEPIKKCLAVQTMNACIKAHEGAIEALGKDKNNEYGKFDVKAYILNALVDALTQKMKEHEVNARIDPTDKVQVHGVTFQKCFHPSQPLLTDFDFKEFQNNKDFAKSAAG